jgi:hypothetical protein
LNIAEVRRLLLVAFVALVSAAAIIAVLATMAGSGADESLSEPTAPAGPLIGDHWHAVIAIFIGDERHPNIPTFTGPEEIHTHGDGIIHMHPFIRAGEGVGASIGKFFEYGGGELTEDTLRIPAQRETHGQANLRILRADSGIHPLGSGFSPAIQACYALPEVEFGEVGPHYIPQDGDCIRIVFTPE